MDQTIESDLCYVFSVWVCEVFKANNGSSNRSGVKLGGDNTRSLQARRLLQGYGFDGYMIKKKTGCAVICWRSTSILSICLEMQEVKEGEWYKNLCVLFCLWEQGPFLLLYIGTQCCCFVIVTNASCCLCIYCFFEYSAVYVFVGSFRFGPAYTKTSQFIFFGHGLKIQNCGKKKNWLSLSIWLCC